MIRNLASGVVLLSVLLVSALLATNRSYALGIGDVRLYTALGQNLDADIPLKDDSGLESWEIKVSLASSQEYAKLKIPKNYFIQSLRLNVENTPSGRIIRIRSVDPVKEPFVNFLIRVEWPSGSFLREVTFLVDPAKYTNEPGARIKAAKASEVGLTPALGSREPDYDSAGITSDADLEAELLGYRSPTDAKDDNPKASKLSDKRVKGGKKVADASHGEVPLSRSSPNKTTHSKQRGGTDKLSSVSDQPSGKPSTTDRQGDRFTYEVQKNDTLWEIARDVRTDGSYTPQQVMLAIQAINPNAFIKGNINRLKRNRTLQLPTADEIAQRSRRDAMLEVRRQNQLFDEFRGTRVAQVDATGKDRVKAGSGKIERDELKLLSASSKSGKGRVSGDTKGERGISARQLKLAQEELDRSKRENIELRSRLKDMREQVATLQRLIALKDEQLASLQAQAAANQSSVSDTTQRQDVDDAYDKSDKSDTRVEKTPVIKSPPEPVDEPTPVVDFDEEAATNLLDDILGGDLMLPVGVGVGALLLLIVVVAIKRRRSMQEEEDYYETDVSSVDVGGGFGLGGSSMAGFEIEEAGPGVDELVKDAADAISYGRYEKAQQMLQEALKIDGSRADVHLKLMEVYVALKDEMSFNKQKAEVLSLGDAADIAKAETLAKSFRPVEIEDVGDLDLGDLEKDIADFGQSKPDAAESEEDLSTEISLNDLEAEMQAEEHMPSEDNNLEFDVGDIDLEAPEILEDEQDDTQESTQEETTLEFDLSSLTSAEPEAPDEPELPPTMELPELDEGSSAATSTDDMSMDFDGFDASVGTDIPDLSSDSTSDFSTDSDSADNDLSMDFDTSDLSLGGSDDLSAPTMEAPTTDDASSGLEFDMGGLSLDSDASSDADLSTVSGTGESASEEVSLGDLDSDMGSVDFGLGLDEDSPSSLDMPATETISAPDVSSVPETSVPEPPTEPAKDRALSVDLDSINLDGGDEDMNFLGGTDEAETKLDLARAYIDMDDLEGAKDILQEVMDEGNTQQKADAQKLMDTIA